MTVEEKVQSILVSNAGLLALVASDKIKPPGDWQGLTGPYIIHFPLPGDPTRTHDGPKALRIWPEYQVSVFAATYSEARRIADAVVAALDGYSDVDTDQVMLSRSPAALGYDTDLKLAHVVIGFQIAGALT